MRRKTSRRSVDRRRSAIRAARKRKTRVASRRVRGPAQGGESRQDAPPDDGKVWVKLDFAPTPDGGHRLVGAELESADDPWEVAAEPGEFFDLPQYERALELVIGYLVRGGPAEAAVTLLDDLLEEVGYPPEPAGQFITILVNAHLVHWVAGSIAQRVDHDVAVDWVTDRLGAEAGAAAAGLVAAITSPRASVPGEPPADPSEFIAAAVWLCSGLVATAGAGDVNWLSQLAPTVSDQVG